MDDSLHSTILRVSFTLFVCILLIYGNYLIIHILRHEAAKSDSGQEISATESTSDDFETSIKQAAELERQEQEEIAEFEKSIDEAAKWEAEQERKEKFAAFMTETYNGFITLGAVVAPVLKRVLSSIAAFAVGLSSCLCVLSLVVYVKAFKSMDNAHAYDEEPEPETLYTMQRSYKNIKWFLSLTLISLLCIMK